MQSAYFDEIHKKEFTLKTLLGNLGIIFAAVILTFVLMLVSGFFPAVMSFVPILFFCVWFGAIFLIKSSFKEYEYIFTEGEIDVDMIIGRSRRKRIVTIKVEQILSVEKYTNDSIKRLLTPDVKKKLDLSSGDQHSSYIITTSINSTKTLIILSPSARLIEEWKPYLLKKRIML